MKSIKTRFEQSKRTKYRECCGDYIHLGYAVMYQNFKRDSITRLFQELVSKDQYLETEKKWLIDHLVTITAKQLTITEFGPEIA